MIRNWFHLAFIRVRRWLNIPSVRELREFIRG